MRYINLRFTYLLTYLLTYLRQTDGRAIAYSERQFTFAKNRLEACLR